MEAASCPRPWHHAAELCPQCTIQRYIGHRSPQHELNTMLVSCTWLLLLTMLLDVLASACKVACSTAADTPTLHQAVPRNMTKGSCSTDCCSAADATAAVGLHQLQQRCIINWQPYKQQRLPVNYSATPSAAASLLLLLQQWHSATCQRQ